METNKALEEAWKLWWHGTKYCQVVSVGYTDSSLRAASLESFTEGYRQAPANKDGDGWRPIESAPKDGTEVLLYSPYDDVGTGAFHNNVWRSTYQGGCTVYDNRDRAETITAPTHWQPLPQPPEREE